MNLGTCCTGGNAALHATQVLLDLDANADGGEQGSQCDDVEDGARKLHIPSPCKSIMPAAAKPLVLDPAVQQQMLLGIR